MKWTNFKNRQVDTISSKFKTDTNYFLLEIVADQKLLNCVNFSSFFVQD